MGHEIAHAVAKHSVERMSAAMAVNVTTQIADIFTGGKISQTRNTGGKSNRNGCASAWNNESFWKKTRK